MTTGSVAVIHHVFYDAVMTRDVDPALIYIDGLYIAARKRISEHGRLPVGAFGVPEDVFLAVESRLRYHLAWWLKPPSAYGYLEDAVLLAVENHYPMKRRNPKFDIDDWMLFVDDTVLHGEAEVYLWWRTHGLETHPVPEKLKSRITLLETVMANGIDDDIIGSLMGFTD